MSKTETELRQRAASLRAAVVLVAELRRTHTRRGGKPYEKLTNVFAYLRDELSENSREWKRRD